jgi:hypothetical protein
VCEKPVKTLDGSKPVRILLNDLKRFTVASRPKILQNNSKPAVEKIVCREKLAAVRPPFLGKSGQKNFAVKNWFLMESFA